MRLQLCPVMMPSIFHLFSLILYPSLNWRTRPKTQLLVSQSRKITNSIALKFDFCVLNSGQVVSIGCLWVLWSLNWSHPVMVAIKNTSGNFPVKMILPCFLTKYNNYSSSLFFKLKTVGDSCLLYCDHCFPQKKAERKNALAQHVCISYLLWSCFLSLSNYLCSDFGIIHCIQVQVAWLFWLALWSIGGLFFCNSLGRVLRKNQRLGWGRGLSGFRGTRCLWFRDVQLRILKVDG